MVRVTEMLPKLGWETLEVRRSKLKLAMFYTFLSNPIAIQTTQLIIMTNATRQQHTLTVLQLKAKASYKHYSFYHWTIHGRMPYAKHNNSSRVPKCLQTGTGQAENSSPHQLLEDPTLLSFAHSFFICRAA